MATDRGSLRFTVLGPVRAWRDDREVPLGPPQQRAVLALLLAQAGRPVTLEALVDALWPVDPPVSAVNVVHRYVGTLRRLFEPALPVRAAGSWLIRSAGGYRLDVDADSLDLLRFRDLVARGGRAGPDEALDLYARALELSDGPAGAGIEGDVRALAVFAALDQEHLEAVRAAADVALRAGAPDRVLAPVRRAALDHPLDEPLHARLMLLLAAGGRRAEALRSFHTLRDRLDEDLGVGPSAEVVAAHDLILRDTTGPARPRAVRPPAQLPADVASFTGRLAELSEVLGLLDEQPAPASVVISALGGMAGIGKTTLAVHWAHQVADRFPDGQLFLNLRGFGPAESVLTPAQALRYLLDAFAVPQAEIPAELDAQAALYRSLVAGRRMLIVLDNARDAEQVRPLLPGSSTCFTIVTSRDTLAELIAVEGAHVLTLGPLPEPIAREFLGRRLGAARVAAEPAAVTAIVAACAGLPLGLAIVAARAAVHPHFSLASIADELRAAHGTLQAFSGLDRSADPTVLFSWSYQALSPDAARLFRHLGLHPGPHVEKVAAARLAGLSVDRTAALLVELTRAHLLTEIRPGRFAFHDLLRAYAAQLAATDAAPDRRAAHLRLLRHYLGTAAEAMRVFLPSGWSARLSATWRSGEPFAGRDAALAWLGAERPVLLAAQKLAVAEHFDEFVCHLPHTLGDYLEMSGRWGDWADSLLIALAAAQRAGDRAAEAESFRELGVAQANLGDFDRAAAFLDRGLVISDELGDRIGSARAHRALAYTRSQQHRLREGLHHAEAALVLQQAAGSSGLGNALNSVGWYHALLGHYDEAYAYCLQALEAFRDDETDTRGAASVLDSLGYIARHLGEHERAVAYYRQAVALRRANQDRFPQASSLLGLASVHDDAGDPAAAAAARREALGILDDLGHPKAAEVQARLDEVTSGQ